MIDSKEAISRWEKSSGVIKTVAAEHELEDELTRLIEKAADEGRTSVVIDQFDYSRASELLFYPESSYDPGVSRNILQKLLLQTLESKGYKWSWIDAGSPRTGITIKWLEWIE